MAQNDPPQKPDDGRHTSPFGWRYYVWLLVLLAFVFYWVAITGGQGVAQIPYSQFKQDLRNGKIASVTMEGENISGQYKGEKKAAAQGKAAKKPEGGEQAAPAQPKRFSTIKPPYDDPQLATLLDSKNVTVRAEPAGGPWWAKALIGVLPWVLLIGLFYWGSKKMQERMAGAGGQGGLFGFGKSKAKRFRQGMTNVTFDDVAGLENAKRDLREIIGYLKDPERYQAIGAKIPKGTLLMGHPGTGKTLLAKAVAGEAGVPFYSISGSEFIEMFVGVGAARVRDMFDSAKKEAPAIIFIDEIDSVGRARGTGVGGGHDEREQTLNQILSEMDGFEPHETVVVMAATNRPDVLDPALLRPGRFDRKVVLELPRKEARRRILQVHTRKVPLADDVELGIIADRTVGFSGADLENLVNEAALLSGREHKEKVDMAAFTAARDKIILGERREELLSDEERKVVAYHESGHALMAWLLPEADPLDKVTIIPRGRALGATEQTPGEDRHNLKRSYLLDRITVMLGGRVAERVVFGDLTSGAESDLKQATQLARRMVCNWGMSEKLGPVAFRQGEEHVFLGREMTQPREFSEHTAEIVDNEIHDLIAGLEQRAIELMEKHRDKLEALSSALMKSETLESSEVDKLFKKAAA
jgi:cell division protease FtsH